MTLVILDLQIDGDILPPEDFLRDLKDFNIAKVLFRGKFSGQLLVDVRNGVYPVQEGMVVKGVVDGKVCRVKIKTNAYLERLKDSFGDSWGTYWE